jgi:hypothetical protein
VHHQTRLRGKVTRPGRDEFKTVECVNEKGRNSEGHLVMVNGLLFLALGTIYMAKYTMRFTNTRFPAFLLEEVDSVQHSLNIFVKSQRISNKPTNVPSYLMFLGSSVLRSRLPAQYPSVGSPYGNSTIFTEFSCIMVK